MRRSSIVGLALLIVGACSGKSPAPVAPTAVQPLPLPTPVPSMTVFAGDTGLPLAGAQVIIAGASLVTDAAGQVRPATAPVGATVDIVAAGYFDRQTLVRSGSESFNRFTLWPRRPVPQFDEDYTRMLVYTSSFFGNSGDSVPLIRLGTTTTQVRIVLPPDLMADPNALFFHQFAADNMNTAVSGRFRYSVGSDSVPGSLNAAVRVAPGVGGCSDNVAAYASMGTNGRGEITSISITYCEMRWARDGGAVLHEMGHTLGLQHSTLRGDAMFPIVGRDLFSDRELLLMNLMYQRPAGNVFPDNDRTTTGIASAQVQTIFCAR